MITKFSEHSKLNDDGVIFVICENEDVQEMAEEILNRRLTEKEMGIVYEEINENLLWRDELHSAIIKSTKVAVDA